MRLGLTRLGGRGFAPLLALTVLGFGGYVLLLPVVPLWVSIGGSGAFGAGAGTGLFMLVTVLTQPVVPWALRHHGYRPVLAGGLVLLGVPAPLTALSADLAPVLALAAVRGIGFGLLTVAGSAMVAELVAPRELGRATAVYGLAIGVPHLVLLPAGVWMVDRVGFGPVLAAGAAPLLGLALLALVPALRSGGPGAERAAEPGTGRSVEPGTGRSVEPGTGRSAEPGMGRSEHDLGHADLRPSGWRIPGATGPVLAMLACATAQGGLVTFLPLAHPGAGAAVPLALFGTAAGTLGGRLLAGQLADRRGWGGRLLLPGLACGLAGMLAEVAALVAAGLPAAGVTALVAAGATAVGVGFGLVQNDSLVALFAAAGPARYGGASALWNITYDAGTGAGAIGLGAIAQGLGYPVTFAASAALLTLAAAGVRVRRRPAT